MIAIVLGSCRARKVHDKQSEFISTTSSDSTVETLRTEKIKLSEPADSAVLKFTLAPISDTPVVFQPQEFQSTSGRATATATVDKLGNIMLKANCAEIEKELEFQVKETQRFRKLYESKTTDNSKVIKIIQTHWWVYPTIIACVAITLTILVHTFISPIKFLKSL
jgi:hypothetical protein